MLARTPVLVLLASAAFVAQVGLSAPSPQRAGKEDPVVAQLRADPRLQKPVTLSLADRPLGEALPELGKTLGVPLSADRSVSDDQATFFCKEHPAAEVLPQVATHFGFLWRRQGNGYQLWQDLAGQQREAALRVEEVQGVFRRLGAQVDRLVAAAAMTPERREATKKELLDALNTGKLAPSEREEAGNRIFALESVDPLLDAGVAVLRGITPAQVRSLAAGDTLILSTVDGTLPAPIAQRINASLRRQNSDEQANGAGVSLRISDGVGALRFDPPEDAPVLVKPVLQFHGMFSSTTTRGPNMHGSSSRSWEPLPPGPILVEPPMPPPGEPELLKEVALVAKPRREQIRLSEVAALIHEATGLPVLADSFVGARISDDALPGRKPLYQMLRAIEQTLGYRYELRDGVLLLRSERYFRDRPREVPLRVRKQWRERLVKQGVLSLNDLAEIASTLSDDQLRGLSTYWYWQFEPPASERVSGSPAVRLAGPPINLTSRRYDLRLWQSLNAAQRTMARKGVLPIRTLNGVQQRLALTAFVTPQDEPDRDLSGSLPPPADLTAGGFSVVQESQRVYEYRIRQADGSGSTGSHTLSPGEPLPAPPMLNDGDRLRRSIRGQDVYQFRYLLPGTERPASIRVLNVSHVREPVK